jgi:hypothetical protein
MFWTQRISSTIGVSARRSASLSPAERERFRGFEKVKGDWHEFRDLLHH